MNISSTNKSTEINTQDINTDNQQQINIDSGMISFKDVLQNQGISENRIMSEATQSIGLLDSNYTYDSMSMDYEDAMFFINLTHGDNFAFTINNTSNEVTNQLVQLDVSEISSRYKNIEVSKTLTNLISKAQNTQSPVRIDFDNNVSVILKVDKQGKITAQFIPGDAAVENYLRNNIESLKQRFEEQNLPYNELSYRQRRHSNQNNNQQQNKGDK